MTADRFVEEEDILGDAANNDGIADADDGIGDVPLGAIAQLFADVSAAVERAPLGAVVAEILRDAGRIADVVQEATAEPGTWEAALLEIAALPNARSATLALQRTVRGAIDTANKAAREAARKAKAAQKWAGADNRDTRARKIELYLCAHTTERVHRDASGVLAARWEDGTLLCIPLRRAQDMDGALIRGPGPRDDIAMRVLGASNKPDVDAVTLAIRRIAHDAAHDSQEPHRLVDALLALTGRSLVTVSVDDDGNARKVPMPRIAEAMPDDINIAHSTGVKTITVHGRRGVCIHIPAAAAALTAARHPEFCGLSEPQLRPILDRHPGRLRRWQGKGSFTGRSYFLDIHDRLTETVAPEPDPRGEPEPLSFDNAEVM